MWKKQFKFLVISIALISINAFFACRDNDFSNKTSFQFEDVTRQAGFEYEHGLTEERFERDIIAGGVAAGDVDIFIANYSESPRLYRNEGGNNLNFLNIKLVGTTPNTDAIGARISLTIEDKTQTREIRSGNNFESQNPAEAHFGLNKAKLIDEIRIRWPDGEITILEEVEANQFLKISHPLLIIE